MSEDRYAYIKDRIDHISDVLDELWNLAEKDEMVSPDEQEILENIQNSIESYQRLASKIIEDHDISDDDLEKLYVFEKQIVQSASSEALKDGYISGEEGDLLQYLLDFFTDLNEEKE